MEPRSILCEQWASLTAQVIPPAPSDVSDREDTNREAVIQVCWLLARPDNAPPRNRTIAGSITIFDGRKQGKKKCHQNPRWTHQWKLKPSLPGSWEVEPKRRCSPKVAGAWDRGIGQHGFLLNSLPLSPQGLRMPVPPRPATQKRRDQGWDGLQRPSAQDVPKTPHNYHEA